MKSTSDNVGVSQLTIRGKIRGFFSEIPVFGWLLGFIVSMALERFLGHAIAENLLKMKEIPVLFGFIVLHRQPIMLPQALLYGILVYGIPMCSVARFSAKVIRPMPIKRWFSDIPVMAWLIGALMAVLLERFLGVTFAEEVLDLNKTPALFGFLVLFKYPDLRFDAAVYVITVYLIPAISVAGLLAGMTNRLASALMNLPIICSVLIHLGLFYLILHLWSDMNAYRLLTVRLILIAVILTLSLNLINGYMGEFSCSHPGFMALGAYAASVITLVLFANDRIFGDALLPAGWGPFVFPLALGAGGATAALGAVLIAIPSFRTRGDYLAIISLAFMFIVKSAMENLEWVGGPRGLGGQPNWANLPVVFVSCVLCIWTINNYVRSVLGKATNTVRDDESAADAMTVDTRRTKMTTFMFAAFWAGVAGGLFAHVLRYVNPGSFYFQRLAEILAMMYFGGLNSVYGSIAGAVSLSLLGEALRPLEIFKWIIIPLILILIMIFRPKGLISFKEFNVIDLIGPRNKRRERQHAGEK